MKTNKFEDPELIGRLDGLVFQGLVREVHELLRELVVSDPADTVAQLQADPARIEKVELLMRYYIGTKEYEKCADIKAVLEEARRSINNSERTSGSDSHELSSH